MRGPQLSGSLPDPYATIRAALLERFEAAQQFWADSLRGLERRETFSSTWSSGHKSATSDKRLVITADLKDDQLEKQLVQVEEDYGIKRKIFFEALWAIVLRQHTGSDDIVFGAANHACSLLDEKCSSADIYPVRVSAAEGAKFGDLVSALESFHRKAFRHSFLEYAEIEHMLPGPLPTSVYYSKAPISFHGDASTLPLVLNISSGQALSLSLDVSSVLERREAEVLLSHFVAALDDALSKLYLPHTSIDDIKIDSREEHVSILRTNRSNKREHPSTIVHLFEEAVREYPDKVALENDQHEKLTFSELNRLSNRLARYLALKKDDIVPICMDRSIDMIVAMLSVLKSGAAYTILDPQSPAERNRQIVEASGANTVLANQQYMDMLPRTVDVDVAIAHCWLQCHEIDGCNLQLSISPEQKAYIIYTSGSTGKPKGVVLTHRAATNGMAYHSLNGRERWLLFYNPTFSAAQRTMLSTLIHGGTLIIAPKSRLQEDLAFLIKDLRVQSLGITPSALSTIRPQDVPSLELVTLVGESIQQSLVSEWADHVELRNTYGLSEVTQLNFGTRLTSTSNPRIVGRPADTTSAFVLKPGKTDLAAFGIAGELGLAGPQLGIGYLNDPLRTAKVFIDNPFGPGKLYRTGDLARMNYDGSFEILGRIDFQAKIAGQKVEPSEVNSALLKHPSVQDVITVAANLADRTTLVAGLVVFDAAEWTSTLSSVRKHAEEQLPSYMVPSFWLRLDEIPKNINGKMDLLRFKNHVESMTMEQLIQDASALEAGSQIEDAVETTIAAAWATLAALRKDRLQTTLNELLSDMTIAEAAVSYEKLPGDETQEDPQPFELVTDSALRRSLIEDTNVVDAYPATALQQDLLSSLGSKDDPYTYRRVWEVSGLDLERLKQSFETYFQRSDILKTSFIAHGRSVFQTIRSDMQLPWTWSDRDLDSYLAQDKAEPFSMDGPLFRISLLSQRLLVVSMHHSLFDFWSFRFLYHDVAAIYFGLTPAVRAPFKRYVNHIAKTNDTKTRRFWKTELTGAEATILNPYPTSSTVKLAVSRPNDLQDRLRELGLTLGAVLYAAWAILLSKHTGTSDVTFLTSLSGRDTPVSGIDSIDGPTLAMVPQRTQLDPEARLDDVARAIGAHVRTLSEHAHYGMRNALSSANLQQDLFDTFLNVLVSPEEDPVTDRVFKRFGPPWQWDNPFTTMEVEERDGQILFRISGRLEERRLQYILDSYLIAIDAIVQEPLQMVSQVDIIGPKEKDYLYNALSNRSTLRVPTPELLHHRFEQHAVNTPEAIAIDWQAETQLSYAELDRRANILAHHLIQTGARVGDRIPLMLDKSIDTMVAILGVMKAGAAYVPLNPENPVERNLFIVKDVQAKTLIVHERYLDFCSENGLPAVLIDQMSFDTENVEAPQISVTPDHLAYIIYTSGSSGMPKGVKVPHRSAAAAVTSMEEAEGRGSGEWRTLQFANYVFDASVQDIFNTLSTGGTLCMAPQDVLLSNLAGTIQSMNVKQAIITPTVAKLLQPSEVPSMTTLIVGGEPLTKDVVAAWAPDHQILNVYGPTETSMVVTTKDVQRGDLISNIGAPFPTVMAFIVDPNGMSLVPYGAVGELCISGPQVTDGYVNRDDLTSAAFVDGSDLEVGRLYRTGDLARWLPGGEISCLGRKDGQIKIHGHRIELGEIEVALVKTGVVEEAAVIVTEVSGKPSLVAFCVFAQSGSTAIQSADEHAEDFKLLRDGLATSGLTPYMIPNIVLPVGALPKLPSRKVDRKTLKSQAELIDASVLRQYALSRAESAQQYVAPANDPEAKLEQLWSNVLGVPASEIGRLADFKALGGDSITAISLSSAISRAGFTLSVSHILRSPRLSEMAALMKPKQQDGSNAARRKQYAVGPEVERKLEEAGLSSEDVEYVYPAPPGQAEFARQGSREEQMWMLMTVRRMPAGTDMDKWTSATTRLIQTNDILRTSWLPVSDEEWAGVVLRSHTPQLEVVDCPSETFAEEFIEKFWQDRFVFGKPFIKFALLKHPDGSCDVVVKLNHAVYDGTLLRIFDDHFGAILADQPIPEHGQFRDFAFHIYESEKAASLNYWKQTMSGRTHTFLHSTPSPKITATTRSIISTDLESLASTTGVSPSSIFQAAYQLWLARTSKSPDVNFDYLLSGRNVDLPDPMTINGTLANFLPVRHQLHESTTTLREFLQATQENFWNMTEHGNVGLDDIYRAAGLDRHAFGNRTLFLFQPFEPAGAPDERRWLVLAKSRVRMYQPYALVVEVAKAVEGRHKLAVMYDETVFSHERAREIAEEIRGIVEGFAVGGGEGRVLEEI
ncbi:uncharacterized protein MYCFIDRAFT_135309 [Pseudocercospora fijiensis CIRAD86]|uniref:Carrier domain-containing protein n=1 Tax=Pseudocercospora fijiensis (strain CIRAD86) TaxID=383855 RepID=M3AKW2_PSEFD|nr:uncharacterized protein MYCFIDRAFT_135309 [Pseudocercospora fijiensis CIRAD86]EME85211.1 hypothetical protein MYCFIDRAFT_135309 [Pseudocercospora fijiensis CIRAD86]